MADTGVLARFQPSRLGSVLVLAGVVAVALNLRTAITTVGPLVPTLRAELAVSNVGLGLIGTVPVLCFGLVSPVAPVLGRWFGIGRALAGSMVLLSVAIAVRAVSGFGWLLAGTIGLGVAIGIGNVLLPALVKGRFPHRTSQLTSAYTALMVLAATVSAGLAVPLAERASLGWALGVWALPAAVGAVVVIASLVLEGRLVPPSGSPAAAGRALTGRELRHQPLAWQVTAFMGLQSLLFYVPIAWLPDVVVERGMTDAQAGALLGAYNVAGLIGVLVIPLLHRGRAGQRRSAGVACALVVAGTALLLVPGLAAVVPAAVLLGLGSGGTISLVLSFFALRTTSAADAAALSGMAQSIGYLVAAAGPVLWGAVRDLSGSWTLPLVLLLGVAVLAAVAGQLAARDRVLRV